MFFNLDGAEGQWFPFFGSHVDGKTGEIVYEEPSSDAKVRLRSMVPFIEELVAKRARNVEHVYNPKTRAMDRVTYAPDGTAEQGRAEMEDAWDYAILEFENFKDKKTGELIPCTRENKVKLMRIPVFNRFFARCQELLGELAVSRDEELQKN